MPDFWTHMLAGELVQEQLPNQQWQTMLTENQQIFNFGCQGPDFLFYNDFWPWISNQRGPEVGTQLHKENIQSFWLTSLDYLQKKKQQNSSSFPQLATYISGMAAHYALDKTAHPFINARTDDFPAHKRLEANLDAYLLKRYKDQQVHKLSPLPPIDVGDNLPPIIKNYYQQVLVQGHSLKQEIDFIDDSYHDFHRVLQLFYSPRRFKIPVFKLLELIFPTNLTLFVYPTQPDYSLLTEEEFNQFEKLLEKGVTEGKQLIKIIIAYVNDKLTWEQLKAQFPDTNFNGVAN